MPCRLRQKIPAGTLALALCLLGSGCEVGPDFHAPTAPPGAGYQSADLPARIDGTPAAQAAGGSQALSLGGDVAGAWWNLFGSADLDRLMGIALVNSPTLEAAQANLLAARELARAQGGTLFPSLSAGAGVTYQRIPTAAEGLGAGQAAAFGQGASEFTLYNTSVSVSYTLDLWGGQRRGVEQAYATAENYRHQLEAAYLTLTTNVASAAVAEASLRAQISATEQVVVAEQDSLRLVGVQLAAGSVTRAELLQQQAQLQTTLATLPPLQSQLAQERNLLATYMGVTPNLFADPGFTLASLHLPADLPVSLPSALVEQRPDIRQAEATLHAQTAAVGVATANLLPQLTLSGDVATEALQVGKLFAPGSLAYTVAAAIAQPIFQGGTLIHRRRAAVAQMQAAAAEYRQTVINAFGNVADVLQALQYDATGLKVAQDAAHSARQSLDLLRVQYAAGSINQVAVLTAEQTEQTALVTLARAEAARLSDTVALFQALGGGWWHRQDVAPAVQNCCKLLP